MKFKAVGLLARPMAATNDDTVVAMEKAEPVARDSGIKIDDEVMTVTDAKDAKNLVVARGTPPEEHAVGAIVYIGVVSQEAGNERT